MIETLLAGGALDVAFQPIVDLEHGRVFGYEALGRAPNSGFGPADLLDHAYAEGRLLALDRAWRRIAIRAIAEWPARDRSLFWFFNVDTRALTDAGFAPGFTHRVLEEHGLSDLHVAIELGERDPKLDAARVAMLAPSYREQGFAIAIDDFGAGHASIASLLAVRPRFLKLDRSLVHGSATNPLRAALLRALADLAACSRMTLVAEGIEREDDLEAVRLAGVRYGQGWLLGRPAALPHRRETCHEVARDDQGCDARDPEAA